MPKSLDKSEFEKIIKPLPAKDRTALRELELTKPLLEEKIAVSRRMMKRDVWVGIPWFIAYSVALYTKGIGNISIGIFVVGMIYFMYAVFTTGSYGTNRKRIQVYEQLLEKMK